jgi:hypothetical protein
MTLCFLIGVPLHRWRGLQPGDAVDAAADEWQKGAQQMNDQKRLEFANDPIDLLAVDGPTNGSKSDGDAATWLSANKTFRCVYVARQTAVKAKFGLWMAEAEHDAIQRILVNQCPDKLVATIDDWRI